MKVVAINNWDEYFDIARKKLSEEIVNMEGKI